MNRESSVVEGQVRALRTCQWTCPAPKRVDQAERAASGSAWQHHRGFPAKPLTRAEPLRRRASLSAS